MHDKPAPAWLMVIGGFVTILVVLAVIGVVAYVFIVVVRWLLGLPV